MSPSQKIILVVDDEPSVCQAISIILKTGGHVVKTFTDPREAANYIEKDSFDIAFIDLVMPHLSGAMLVNLIRKTNPGKPIVIIAARSVLPVDLGVDRVLLKPFSADDLRRAISELVTA